MSRKGCSLGLVSTIGTAALVGFYPVLPEAIGPTPAFAQVGTVTFPELEKLVHYTTVRRGVTREHMLTDRIALDAIPVGQPVPTGTHVVLVDHQSDVLARYLVAEKTGDGSDDWAYQRRSARSRPTMKARRVATPVTTPARIGNTCSPSAMR